MLLQFMAPKKHEDPGNSSFFLTFVKWKQSLRDFHACFEQGLAYVDQRKSLKFPASCKDRKPNYHVLVRAHVTSVLPHVCCYTAMSLVVMHQINDTYKAKAASIGFAFLNIIWHSQHRQQLDQITEVHFKLEKGKTPFSLSNLLLQRPLKGQGQPTK